MRLFYLTFLLSLSYFQSCSQSEGGDEKEIREYVLNPANGLHHTLRVNQTLISLSYKPIDLFLAQDLKRFHTLRQHVVDSLRSLYSGNLYFALDLSINGREIESQFLTNKLAYDQVLQYLNHDIGKQISVTVDNLKNLPISGHVFVRMYGSKSKTHLVIAIKRNEIITSSKFEVIIDDTVLGIGKHIFSFKTNDIINTPSLEFDL